MNERTTSERMSQNYIDVLEDTLRFIKKEIRKKNPKLNKETLYERYLHLLWQTQHFRINWSSEMYKIMSDIEKTKFKNNKEPVLKLIFPRHYDKKVK